MRRARAAPPRRARPCRRGSVASPPARRGRADGSSCSWASRPRRPGARRRRGRAGRAGSDEVVEHAGSDHVRGGHRRLDRIADGIPEVVLLETGRPNPRVLGWTKTSAPDSSAAAQKSRKRSCRGRRRRRRRDLDPGEPTVAHQLDELRPGAPGRPCRARRPARRQSRERLVLHARVATPQRFTHGESRTTSTPARSCSSRIRARSQNSRRAERTSRPR